ncbi:NUDIX hydrolase [Amycolatopsis saalfeldensis]|uniref:NUDIX domain-containing protein n=1 Tax=Amycolatopsis saalfeldensis TaxID=394193 RepID=A0A1H8YQ04_9PSEU|nr:NUDIX hydrolase [Amycolatopsis saalfeldensis]SEP54163.1 NUDIX domain-containing protein [Amycolatopsis saalfeldensis]
MAYVNAWTGRTAGALQAALRMSNEGFAKHLGVAVRTVAAWHSGPDVTPRSEMQDALDTAFDRASDSAKARFRHLVEQREQSSLSAGADGEVQALRVAIAVVVDGAKVLVVCRRGEDGNGISWQFPAGMVKPGVALETVAVRETLAETGVHCSIVRKLGSRLHPITHVQAEYMLCEYLTGEAQNMDVLENVSVVWVEKSELTRFIPADRIYPPILEVLEVAE